MKFSLVVTKEKRSILCLSVLFMLAIVLYNAGRRFEELIHEAKGKLVEIVKEML